LNVGIIELKALERRKIKTLAWEDFNFKSGYQRYYDNNIKECSVNFQGTCGGSKGSHGWRVRFSQETTMITTVIMIQLQKMNTSNSKLDEERVHPFSKAIKWNLTEVSI